MTVPWRFHDGDMIWVTAPLAARGFHPELPKYGFGDPTSYRIIEDVVGATLVTGAVRHGAECFNFYFPQELDDEFLVIWDGFTNPPWKSFKEEALRHFLTERVKEGYGFPINPVWPVRDKGWYDVLNALQGNPEAASNLKSWFPPESGVLDKIKKMHSSSSEGFKVLKKEKVVEAPRPESADKGKDKKPGTVTGMLGNFFGGGDQNGEVNPNSA